MGLSKHQKHGMNALGIFSLKNGFRIGKADSTLFTRKMGKDLFVYQIYIDAIIFGSTKKFFCDEFSKIMTDRFEMSMKGFLTFFLGYRSMIGSLLYLCVSIPNIMLSVCICARFQVTPKDCHLRVLKRIMRYLVLTPNLGLLYPKGFHFELFGYSDADYAGCKVDMKSTSRTCQFLGRSLVSWSSKK
jgi:hypothetical protein